MEYPYYNCRVRNEVGEDAYVLVRIVTGEFRPDDEQVINAIRNCLSALPGYTLDSISRHSVNVEAV